jgi:hypothetical protein
MWIEDLFSSWPWYASLGAALASPLAAAVGAYIGSRSERRRWRRGSSLVTGHQLSRRKEVR